jgi:A/G-specific adenine glycosylase
METDKNTQQPQDYCVQKIHDKQALSDFCDVIKKYYQESSRSFAWRKDITPYRVVVSEVMLQQTQTDRVAIKFDQFISSFPDFYALAHAPFDELLRVWKGLGYNRRAIAEICQIQLIFLLHFQE